MIAFAVSGLVIFSAFRVFSETGNGFVLVIGLAVVVGIVNGMTSTHR
jgi:hypothetical protein